MSKFRDRIKGFKRIPAADLLEHEKNWRTHPQGQKNALRDVLAEIGLADAAIVFPVEVDGVVKYKLIDGHLRRELVTEQGVPCLITDLTAEEAEKMLLVLDPLAAMAGADSERTRALLRSVSFEGEGVKDLLGHIGDQYAKVLPPEVEKVATETFAEEWNPSKEALEMYELREAQIFPSSNRWGIPDLRADRLCTAYPTKVFAGNRPEMPTSKDACDEHLFICGNSVGGKPPGGFLCFFIDDSKFEKVWDNAVEFARDLHRLQWRGVVAPDFTLYNDDPPVVRLWQIYRSRWVARYWQELGFEVIPNIQDVHDWFMLGPRGGLPEGCKVVALQCRTNGDNKEVDDTAYYVRFARQVDEIRPEVVVVYGGAHHKEKIASRFPKGPEYILLPSYINERNAFLQSRMSPEQRRGRKRKAKKE